MRKEITLKGYSVAEIADALNISQGRVRQLVGSMKLRAVQKIGNVQFYSSPQVLRMESRNMKPGPRNGDKPKSGQKGKR